jgi:hypothetical protein
MGSISLARIRSVRPEERRELAVGIIRSYLRSGIRSVQTLWFVILPIFLVLLNSQARHWLSEALATVTVVGGFLAAPILTLMAWIGLALPEGVLLHRASTAMFLIAIIWMAFALIGAHLHHHRHYAQDSEADRPR